MGVAGDMQCSGSGNPNGNGGGIGNGNGADFGKIVIDLFPQLLFLKAQPLLDRRHPHHTREVATDQRPAGASVIYHLSTSLGEAEGDPVLRRCIPRLQVS